jgi:hypothetical protein
MAVEVEGLDALNAQLRRMAREAPHAVRRASFAGALVIEGKAKENTPVEYGELQGSAYTQATALGAETGFSAEYALWVHENTEEKLRGEPRPSGLGTYWNPGGSKFLERAVDENSDEVVDIVEAYLERAINGAT